MSKIWKAALVVDDADAMRVLSAWYSGARNSYELHRISGVENAAVLLERLRAAELITDEDEPPPHAQLLLTTYVQRAITLNKRRRPT